MWPRWTTLAHCVPTGGVTLGGERLGVRIDGFDLGNSPREYLEVRTPTLAMSTTNGTRAIVAAAERCERVLIASLLNLAAVTEAARCPRRRRGDLLRRREGRVRAGRQLRRRTHRRRLGGDRSDAAEAAVRLAASYATAEEARASRSGRNLINHGPELEADIPYCARESVLTVVPRLVGMHGIAAEIRLRLPGVSIAVLRERRGLVASLESDVDARPARARDFVRRRRRCIRAVAPGISR